LIFETKREKEKEKKNKNITTYEPMAIFANVGLCHVLLVLNNLKTLTNLT
jgi:hypothetical protein